MQVCTPTSHSFIAHWNLEWCCWRMGAQISVCRRKAHLFHQTQDAAVAAMSSLLRAA